MKKLKVLVCGAVFSTSGYAEHARVILRALRTIEDKIDLYILPYKWSSTTDTYQNDEENKWFRYLISKTNPNMLGYFDISIQLGVPTEWKKFAKYNIGVTAGVETLSMNPEWIQYCNSVDKVMTVSEFSKRTILNTVHENNKVTKPVEVIAFPHKDVEKIDFDLNIETTFNFLCVSQWAPRKNLENMLSWFVETFHDNKDVGLIIKSYHQANSTPDFYNLDLLLYEILHKYKDRKCKVYFIHGDLSDQQLQSLYTSNNVKVFVNNSHGEGFCIPMFDAACNAIPVIAPDFSGYKDYMYQVKEDKLSKKGKIKPFFQKVDCDINPVQQNHIMPSIINPGMLWCYAKQNDFKNKLLEMYKDYGRFKKQATELRDILVSKYSKEQIYSQYINSIFEKFNLEDVQEDEVIEV